jgi:hypothetical protein
MVGTVLGDHEPSLYTVSTTPDDRRGAGVEFTHEGGGEPIEDEDAFLEEIGIDPDEIDEDPSLPPCFE